MIKYKISEIYIYPVKSLPGISLQKSFVEERGLKFDRRWMLVDEENMFITQRLFPQMVFINVHIDNETLTFTHKRKSLETLNIPINKIPQEELSVEIWDDTCTAREYGNEINNWFSEALEFKCKLVYMPDSTERPTSTKYFPESKKVSFADGYPILIIGQESLNFLNAKLEYPADMIQFRPNIVFSGGQEHEEDKWNEIIIGGTKFNVVKPCARCVITTINTENATKNKEPLSTLSKYRNFNNKIMFGQNVISHSEGLINIGDQIKVR